MSKKSKKAWGIFSLAALMAFLNACNKDPIPEPQPDNPNDTVQPIVPTREITIPWCWSAGQGLAPNMDTIKFYATDPTVKYVFLYLIPGHETTWEPRHFHEARDTLQTRIDIDPNKVSGRGDVKVGRDGAQIHPDTLTKKYGMWEPDSVWFAQHGWRVGRFL